jgi:hypothetical protein
MMSVSTACHRRQRKAGPGASTVVFRTLHAQTNLDFAPLRVTFTHPRAAGQREVHRLLRCPVEFAQTVDSWVLPQRVMDLPIVSGDSTAADPDGARRRTADGEALGYRLAERGGRPAHQPASQWQITGRGGRPAAQYEHAVIGSWRKRGRPSEKSWSGCGGV